MDAEKEAGSMLATELLHEIKLHAKRWFVIAIIELLVILCMAGGFLWYISLPVEEVFIENESGNANYVGNDLNGRLYNGENNGEETWAAEED